MAAAVSVYADTYKYVDDGGRARFAIRMSDIPARYRSRAVKVRYLTAITSGRTAENTYSNKRMMNRMMPEERKRALKYISHHGARIALN